VVLYAGKVLVTIEYNLCDRSVTGLRWSRRAWAMAVGAMGQGRWRPPSTSWGNHNLRSSWKCSRKLGRVEVKVRLMHLTRFRKSDYSW